MDFENFTAFETPEEGLEEYLENFLDKRRSDLDEMKTWYEKNDMENVKKILHKWEGFAEPYGFGGLRVFSGQVRASIQLQKPELFEKICTQLQAYLLYKERTLLER